jgi:hypothetical protein
MSEPKERPQWNAREMKLALSFHANLKPGENWTEALAFMLAAYREEVLAGRASCERK